MSKVKDSTRPITEPDTLAVVLQSALQYPASVVAGYRIRSEGDRVR